MATVEIRPAVLSELTLMVPRQRDIDELWSSCRYTPYKAIEFGITHGKAWVGYIGTDLLGVFGVVPHGEIGAIWAVFTDSIERHPISFLRSCLGPLKTMKSEYSVLINYVDERNTKVIQWLRWLGFTIYPAEPYGVDQLPFHRFELKHV